MSTTYNPRDNTFIKKPEPSTCPTCGQLVQDLGKPFQNHMNNYISETGVIMTMNSNDDIIEIKGVPMYKCDDTNSKNGLMHVSRYLENKKRAAAKVVVGVDRQPQVQQQQVQQQVNPETIVAPQINVATPPPISKLQASQLVAPKPLEGAV